MEYHFISNIYTYRTTVKRNYLKFQQVTEKINELMNLPNRFLLGDDLNDALDEFNNQKSNYAIACIVFQSMAIEAFCNEYIATNLSKAYIESLDKLDVKAKLLLSCKMITGKDFPKDGHAYELLQKLISKRNKLVHFKIHKINFDDLNSGDYIYDDNDIPDVIVTYDKIIEQLRNLDSGLSDEYSCEILDDFWTKSN